MQRFSFGCRKDCGAAATHLYWLQSEKKNLSSASWKESSLTPQTNAYAKRERMKVKEKKKKKKSANKA